METMPITTKDVERRLITLRGQRVLLDRDVADLYGVETKRVNEAVKNNPRKFPGRYVFKLEADEIDVFAVKIFDRSSFVVENFDRKNISPKSRYAPTAFTERGLYMLATILKSDQACKSSPPIRRIIGFTSAETYSVLQGRVSLADHKSNNSFPIRLHSS